MSKTVVTVGITVRNQLTYVRRCLRSVLRCMSLPTEIIIVDDASIDVVAEYLRDLADERPSCIKVLTNQQREGFAFGVNRILEEATGDPIILLNSDTVVTPNWDRGLVDAFAMSDRVALAGPSTSCSHTPQTLAQCRFDRFDVYDSQIVARARRFESKWEGQYIELERLGGFCLAVRRSILERVGFFDERFCFGPFEENDYADRVVSHGYICLWVKGVYVHHFGGRTLAAEPDFDYKAEFERAKRLYLTKRSGKVREQWLRRPPGTVDVWRDQTYN